ncbi:hypothetical protein [Oceanicaulis alexandrii]|uniref:hypothetical protein n=1 Tax=Oceanicaulis alexandrii TaxID=153233 RepID=UPI003B505553
MIISHPHDRKTWWPPLAELLLALGLIVVMVGLAVEVSIATAGLLLIAVVIVAAILTPHRPRELAIY